MKRSVREDWEFLRSEWKFLLIAPLVILALAAVTSTGAEGVYAFGFLALAYRALRERWRDDRA